MKSGNKIFWFRIYTVVFETRGVWKSIARQKIDGRENQIYKYEDYDVVLSSKLHMRPSLQQFCNQ